MINFVHQFQKDLDINFRINVITDVVETYIYIYISLVNQCEKFTIQYWLLFNQYENTHNSTLIMS